MKAQNLNCLKDLLEKKTEHTDSNIKCRISALTHVQYGSSSCS